VKLAARGEKKKKNFRKNWTELRRLRGLFDKAPAETKFKRQPYREFPIFIKINPATEDCTSSQPNS